MATQLATLAQVKEYLDIVGTADDGLLTRLIDVCSTSIEKWCSRTFGLTVYTDTLDGNGKQWIPVAQYPITAIDGITINDDPIPQSTGLAVAGYYFTPPQKVQLRGGYTFARGSQNIVIQYRAGYSILPADVVQCCIKLVAVRYKERDRLGISSKTLNGESISFTVDDFPESIVRVLNDYKAVVTI